MDVLARLSELEAEAIQDTAIDVLARLSELEAIVEYAQHEYFSAKDYYIRTNKETIKRVVTRKFAGLDEIERDKLVAERMTGIIDELSETTEHRRAVDALEQFRKKYSAEITREKETSRLAKLEAATSTVAVDTIVPKMSSVQDPSQGQEKA
ncbi:MAG: hypothetical protein EBQ80_06195 [Proteobacteria bacterium]|nr:hypothetical protein [Pseudomonadota bacterium]